MLVVPFAVFRQLIGVDEMRPAALGTDQKPMLMPAVTEGLLIPCFTSFHRLMQLMNLKIRALDFLDTSNQRSQVLISCKAPRTCRH